MLERLALALIGLLTVFRQITPIAWEYLQCDAHALTLLV